jgi:hypothetical protein
MCGGKACTRYSLRNQSALLAGFQSAFRTLVCLGPCSARGIKNRASHGWGRICASRGKSKLAPREISRASRRNQRVNPIFGLLLWALLPWRTYKKIHMHGIVKKTVIEKEKKNRTLGGQTKKKQNGIEKKKEKETQGHLFSILEKRGRSKTEIPSQASRLGVGHARGGRIVPRVYCRCGTGCDTECDTGLLQTSHGRTMPVQ